MVLEIWRSYRAMPLWVQIWVALILVPVNMFSLVFVTAPVGLWVAALAIGAMLLNLVLMLIERGLSRAMALPHVLIWTPLVIWVGWMLAQGTVSGRFATYLLLLLVVDGISLALDFRDARDWLVGNRAVAGRK